jgi:hypothetical protein
MNTEERKGPLLFKKPRNMKCIKQAVTYADLLYISTEA